MIISYAITVCNEHGELKRLLNFLIKKVREGDEIIVQHDEENTTLEVLKVLNKYADRVKIIEFPLNGHFANFKNNLTENCKGDWIFQIDADEIPHENLIKYLPEIILSNPDNEVIRVPRVNTVFGLTEEYTNQWGWNINERDWINWPDFQWRIWKNHPKIKWVNKVHEILEGYNTYSDLHKVEEYALYHPKDIEKQIKQNNYYEKISTNTK
jgi:glycosyltransferase involved in cell wall biosynthesis